jgi:acyl-CoA thioesterase-1
MVVSSIAFWGTCLLSVILITGAFCAPATFLPASQGIIVAAGNSLTAGLGVAESEAYPALLERMLNSEGLNYRVINVGISGETSSGLRARIKWLLTLKPDIVIVETGANDGMRGIDLRLIRQNIHHIVRVLKENQVIPILVGMQMFPNLGVEYTRAYSRIYPEIAEEEGIVFMPFFLAEVAGKSAFNQADGIHPNANGYRVITENLYPYVVEAIRQHRAAQ